MRIFGRPISKLYQYEPSAAPELQDLELVAGPKALRRLASLLNDVAADMEAKGSRFEHVHLLDAWSAHGKDIPDIVFSRPQEADVE